MARTPEEEVMYQELLKKTGRTKKSNPKEESNLDYIASSWPIQAVLGAGDELSNMLSSSYATITGGEYSPIKSGEGASYDIGSFFGAMAPFIAAPGATIPARLGVSTVTGGLFNPEDPAQGAIEGAAWGTFGEALPYVGKGVTWGADKFTRKGYTEELMNSMYEHFKASQAEAMKHLSPIMDKFGNKKMPDDAALEVMFEHDKEKDYLGIKINKLYKEFSENATFDNAQKLQSQTGDQIRGIKGSDAYSIKSLDALIEFRESILNSMKQGFAEIDPSSAKEYDLFRKIYAKEVGPYLNNPSLNRIVHKETTGMTPNKLESVLNKSVEGTRSKVPKEHYLNKLAPEITGKMGRSDIYSALGAGTLGAAAMGVQGVAAAGLPKALGKFSPDFSFIVHDQIQKLLGNVYPSARQGMIGLAVSPENEIRVRSKFNHPDYTEELESAAIRGEALK